MNELPPWPGDELVSRVTGLTDRDVFFESGQQSVRDLNRALAVIGRSLESYPTILEFGCGCGRIMLWLEQVAAGAELHGVDIDERAIRWAQANIPYASFKVNDPLPPLDYPDAFFDLVYNHSVFTHLDEEYQDRWLAELRRVTKPGGTILLTVHGEVAVRHNEELTANAGGDSTWLREELRRSGIAFVRQDSYVGGPFPDFYHSTFHAPWYVFDRWGASLRVKAYLPGASLGFQDIVVLENPAEGPAKTVGGAPAPAVREAPAMTVSGSEAEDPPAIAAAAALLREGPDVTSATDRGAAATVSRQVVLRALRHYDEHQRRLHEALLESIREIHRTAAGHVHAEEATLRESTGRLADALQRQGDRVNRLEADLWAAIEKVGSDGAQGQVNTPGSMHGGENLDAMS
jgi:SAM-dependent methyltransferase